METLAYTLLGIAVPLLLVAIGLLVWVILDPLDKGDKR